MLRDEATRLVGAARGEALQFPVAAPLRDIEKAWIHTCQNHEARRKWRLNRGDIEPGCLEHRVLSALEQIVEAGAIRAEHLAVLVVNGERGRPPNIRYQVAYELWAQAMIALDATVDLRSAAPR